MQRFFEVSDNNLDCSGNERIRQDNKCEMPFLDEYIILAGSLGNMGKKIINVIFFIVTTPETPCKNMPGLDPSDYPESWTIPIVDRS